MAKRRGNGEGTVYKRSDGTWMAQTTIGRDPATGKLRRKTFYGKTQKEVVAKMAKLQSEILMGNYIEPSCITVSQWLNDWITGRKPHITESTWKAYETQIRCHLVPEIGAIRLVDLRTRDLQQLLNAKLINGSVRCHKSGLSPRSVKYIYSTIQTALGQAVKERIISYNVADAIELPKQRKKEMKVLDFPQMKVFLKTAKQSPYYAAFLLEFSTGLRRGELLGVRWQDIDFNRKALHVRQQVIRTERGLKFSEPKTQKSKRIISLSGEVLESLKYHKNTQNKIKLRLGASYQDNDLTFCTDDGKPIDPRNFVRHFDGLLHKAGIEHIRFHDLRHTFATMALQSGISAKTIQEFLGHSTFKTTMDTYSHVTPQMQADAAKIIGDSLEKCLL